MTVKEMAVQEMISPTTSEIQRTRDEIRGSWSTEERDERRRLSASRQEWLFNVLFLRHATEPARVA